MKEEERNARNTELVCFIPARSGSRGIPDKNVRLLAGKPLLAYSIQSAFAAGVKRVIVDTDSEAYAAVAREWGAETMIRGKALSRDSVSMFEVLRAEVPRIIPRPGLVLLLQPTSPFRSKNQILLAISYFQANLDKYDSLVSVEKVPEKYNPAVVIVQTPTGKGMVMGRLKTAREKASAWFTGKTWSGPALSGIPIVDRITRRQENPEAWVPTGSIYLFKASNLKQGSIYGKETMLLEVEPQININGPEDWARAEEHLNDKEPDGNA